MLYPRNTDAKLSDSLFRNPGSEYRGTPFWAWNCTLKKDELLWQLEVLKKMGLGGAHMHVRTGMATPYLSDEHMDLIKACVEKCREENMLAWLYDEDRWPSGAAGGIVTKDPKYRTRFLLFTAKPYGEYQDAATKAPRHDNHIAQVKKAKFSDSGHHDASGERRDDASTNANGYLLACFDICLDKNGCLKTAKKVQPEDAAQGTKWYIYVQTPEESPWYNNQTYVDTLSKEAIQKFIEVTYERYLETVGDDFGGVVPAMFTDEPQFSRKQTLGFALDQKDVILPWTDDVPQTYLETYGTDIVEHLPELLWDLPEGQVSVARYHYHDHICERFVEAFPDQCGEWCKNHGLMLTGHMMQEPTLQSQTCSLGEAMRCYRGFQLPGIDMLCNRVELTTAKQAQSAAHQYGREGVMSELYGVTSWGFDFRGHKFQGDWQAALGVTVRVHHLSWVSMKGEAKRDYPASISYQSPWWQDYAVVEDHFARVNTALTRGKPVVRVGVIHPVESYWLHFGPGEQTADVRTQMDSNFQNLTKWMLTGCVDFDFISESLLPEQCPAGNAPLKVGEMAYDTIVVPGCETIRSSTLDRLEAFAAAGGKLIFLGAAPKYVDALPSDRGAALWAKADHVDFTKETILAALESSRILDIRNANGSRTSDLITQLRQDGDDRWLFIAHSDATTPYYTKVSEAKTVRIALDGEYDVLKYDTQTGDILPLASQKKNGKTIISAVFNDLDSLLLRYTAKGTVEVPVAAPVVEDAVQHPVPAKVRYTLDEPNVYLLDKAEFALDDAPYQPEEELLRADNDLRDQLNWPQRKSTVAQPWTIVEPAPEHTVRLRFHVYCTAKFENIKLALEDGDVAQIHCNGKLITAKPDGWYTDKSIATIPIGSLNAGENLIEVQLPFGRRTNVEWCYLLGQFGVRVFGEYRELYPMQDYLGFDDIVHQGLAHYGGNVTYHVDVQTKGGNVTVTVPHYAGSGIRVEVDCKKDYILYPPYRLELGKLPAGRHTLNLTLLGNRQNAFGPVHLADPHNDWHGPNIWRTIDEKWTESYRLRPIGILSAPVIEETEV